MSRGKQLTIFILFFLLFAIFTKTETYSWNDASRMATIQSLVEQFSFVIDKSTFIETGDKYFYNNHFYSDKPPILSMYGALYYFVLKNLFNISFATTPRLAYYLVTLLTIGVLTCVGLIYFHKILVEFFEIDQEWADLTTFIVGTGTLVLPYSIVLNNHIVSGVLLLISFYYLLKSKNNKILNVALSGFLVSLAGSVDLNCFLFIPFAVIFFSFTQSIKSGLIFLVSCVPLILCFLGLNFYTSGSIIPPAMNQVLWDYPGSSFNQENLSGLATHKGILGILIYTFHIIFGNRGLISHTPILLFSIFAIFLIFRNNYFPYKKEYLYILGASCAFILLYTLKSVNYSGFSFGVRWFASVMFMLCLPLAHIKSKIKSSRLLKILFIGLIVVSILFSLIGTYNPFTPDYLTDAQRYFNPPNTLRINIRFILRQSTNMYKASLIFSAGIIYFILYKLLQRSNLMRS
ncbi:MAG TPA: hypothetical protein DCE56_19060 [Cyanobacteria bacterium UBA8553]|nr:hypothetical protein [Cyanobacteria bacterium UBA8553]HAJ64731.1 hypothetical protein [Cyanobacteria bacterium UBA8543]